MRAISVDMGTPDIASCIRDFAEQPERLPDRVAVEGILSRTFFERRAVLWPMGDANATQAWIDANLYSMLRVLARLYDQAAASQKHPEAMKFLKRMTWLPELLDSLAASHGQRTRLDA